MPNPISRDEKPQTTGRLKRLSRVLVGPDLTDQIGASNVATNAAFVLSQLATETLTEVGSIENMELVQQRVSKEFYGFNEDPTQPFKIAALGTKATLKIRNIMLNTLSPGEAYFNFLPNNLVHQQIPFIIQHVGVANKPVSGKVGSEDNITTFYFNCYFTDLNVVYDSMASGQKLIKTANIRAGRSITLDGTLGGSPGALVAQTSVSLLNNVTL